jgi:structural maintenance of chromosomes protein 5
MCLGLGGEPRNLGRADDVREFISHGKDKAMVEIELAPHAGKEVHTFRRVIDRAKGSDRGRGKGSSIFYLNGEQTSSKEIQRVVREDYNISIDNLCTFLPQDRVGNFSGFNPKQLLEETEKSLSGSQHLYDTHQTLIQLESDLHLGGNKAEIMEKKLKVMEADFSNMEREKQRMQEKVEALQNIEMLQKKIMWMKYDEIRSRCIELKASKDEARKMLEIAKQRGAPLQDKESHLQRLLDQNNERSRALDEVTQQAKADMQKQTKKFENHSSDMEDVVCQLRTIDEAKRSAIRELEKYRSHLSEEEEHLLRLPDENDLKMKIEEEAQQFKSLAQPARDMKREQSRILQELKESDMAVNAAKHLLNKINDVRQNRRNRVFQQFPNLKQIFDFVDANRKDFRRPVWGPVACEVEIKSNNAAAYLEQHVPNHVFKSFVVECNEDYNLLYQKVRIEMKLPINILSVKDGKLVEVEDMYSERKMEILKRDHGVIGYLDQ